MLRRGWSSLSANYRKRLARGGVSRGSYESGASLRKARGHAQTPERPGQGLQRPEFQPYYQRRPAPQYILESVAYEPTPGAHSEEVKQALAERIYRVFGDRFKFRGALDPDFPPPGKPGQPPYPPAPDDEAIMETLEMDDYELEDLAQEAAIAVTEYWFLWYH